MSLRRSSYGKPSSVASILAVSSMETSCTQLNVSPTGSPSRMSMTRSRMRGSSSAKLRAARAGATAIRCGLCFGSSKPMKLWPTTGYSSVASARSTIAMPPFSDENTPWFVSTSLIRPWLVTDQNGPFALSAR